MKAPPATPAATGRPLPFSLDLAPTRVSLGLNAVGLDAVVRVDTLRLDLPHVHFPVDLSGGVAAFRDHRTELRLARLTVREAALNAGLHAALEHSGGPLVGAEVHFYADRAVVTGQVGTPDGPVAFCLHGRIVPDDGDDPLALRLSLFALRVFGFVPLPWPALAHLVLALLPGAWTRERALTTAVTSPLRPLLRGLLVERGWKLPRFKGLRAAACHGVPDGLQVEFSTEAAAGTIVDVTELADPHARREHEAYVADLEWKGLHAEVDEALAEGDLDGAVREARRRLDAGAERAFLEERLLQTLVAREVGFDAALVLAAERLRADPGSATARLVRAVVFAKRGQAGLARGEIERFVGGLDPQREPEDFSAALLWSAALARPSDPAGERSALERVVAVRPNAAPALGRLGRLAADAGRRDEAAAWWGRLLVSDAPLAEQVPAALDIGRHYLEDRRDPDAARPFFEFAAERAPDDAAAQAALADLAALCGDWQGALAALERVCDRLRGGADPDAFVAAGRRQAELWLREAQDPARAAQALRRVLDERPDAFDVWEDYAGLLIESGRLAEAEAALRHVLGGLGAPPGDPERALGVYRQLGLLLAGNPRRADDARAALAAALALDPGDEASLEGLEQLARTPADWDALAARLQQSVRSVRTAAVRARLLARLARVYDEVFGFAGDAAEMLAEAVALAPGDRALAGRLLALGERLGDWTRVAATLTGMLAETHEAHERAGILVHLATVLADRLGERMAALARLEEATRESPRHREALERLVELQGALGRYGDLARTLPRLAAVVDEPEWRLHFRLAHARVLFERLGRPAEAMAVLDDLPATEQRRGDVRDLRARIALGTNDDAAQPSGVAAPPGAPALGDPDARLDAAVALADAGRLAEAVALLRADFAAGRLSRPAIGLLALLAAQAGDDALRRQVEAAGGLREPPAEVRDGHA